MAEQQDCEAADAGGMLIARRPLTDEDVARLRAGFVITFSRKVKLTECLVLVGPVHFEWCSPIQGGGAEPGA